MTADANDSLLAAAKQALRTGAHDQAIAGFESYLEAHPAHAEALILAAQALRYFNRNDRIVELYARAADVSQDDPEILAGYVESLIAYSQLDRARAVARTAIAAHPEFARLHLLYGHTDLALGNPDAARKVFWTWLEKDPDNTDCAFQLGQIASDEDLPRLSAALDRMWKKKDTRDAWNAATLGYAYGRVAERMKVFENAWEGYSFGAARRRSVTQYDEATFAATPDQHGKLFNAAIANPFEKEKPGAGLVFIVSLPRSGSTLVEQILDAHPGVTAIGEQPFAYNTVSYWHNTFGPTMPKLLSADALEDTREHYIKLAQDAAGHSDRLIVDKSITNYVFLGFLRTILPGARFIHVVRHPLDTAISCFTTSFFAGNEWTYSLEEIGRHVRRYEKIMLHWMNQWPDDILTVRYEDLVQRPEDLSKQIVAFCGLEWDPACLKFHESKRAILTASVNQVRQPIYQSAMGRAAKYEAHLGPLIAAMGRRAADPDWFLPKKGHD